MKTILSILAATALIAPGAIAQEAVESVGAQETVDAQEVVETVDEEFGVREPGPVATAVRSGAHPIARILLFPLMPFIEAQAALSPEKASCWNEGASEVVGCDIVETIEEAEAARPTPYVD